jgi:hypothetical protein
MIALLVAGALLGSGCSGDGSAVDGGDQARAPADPGPSGPPDGAPTLAGPVLDLLLFSPTDRCGYDGPSNHYPTTTQDPATCGPRDDDNVGQIIVADPQRDSRVNGVFITAERRTEVFIADGAGRWRPGRFDELSFGGEVEAWSMWDGPLEHRSGEGFVAGTITYRPPAGPPPPPTSPPPWSPVVAGPVLSVTPCPPTDATVPGPCADGALSSVVVDEARNRLDPNEDQTVAVVPDTVVLIDDGPGWQPGSPADVTVGAPARAWLRTDPTTDRHWTWVVAIGPTNEW